MHTGAPGDMPPVDPRDPDPWLALYLDQSLPMDETAKAALLSGHRTFSRRVLLPLIRPLARLSIILVQLLRFVLPSKIQSSRLLHLTIYWGLKYFVSREANYLILRHFNIGTEVLRFIADNVSGVEITTTISLRPRCLKDLVDNTFLIHDLNIYNFIIELNRQLREQGREIEPARHINFDAVSREPFEFKELPDTWHNVLDIQTAIEVYTPLYALFLTDHDFWRASNSLQLDETIALYVGRICSTPLPSILVNNRHPTVPHSTLEAGYRLMLHGLDAENLYGFIQRRRMDAEKR